MEWINVIDELPKYGERVIATNGEFVGEAYLKKGNIWVRYADALSWKDNYGKKVTYWMRLPAPKK